MNITMFIYSSALLKLVGSLRVVVFTLMGRRFDGNKLPNNFRMACMVVGCNAIGTIRREPAGAMYVVFFHSGQLFPDENGYDSWLECMRVSQQYMIDTIHTLFLLY